MKISLWKFYVPRSLLLYGWVSDKFEIEKFTINLNGSRIMNNIDNPIAPHTKATINQKLTLIKEVWSLSLGSKFSCLLNFSY